LLVALHLGAVAEESLKNFAVAAICAGGAMDRAMDRCGLETNLREYGIMAQCWDIQWW